MKSKIFILLWAIALLGKAQETHQINGVYSKNSNYIAFVNATIHQNYKHTIQGGTLLIQNGKVIAVGKTVNIPKQCTVKNLNGKHIYPSFIDMYSNYGVRKNKNALTNRKHRGAQTKTNKAGAYNWNQAIQPETNAVENFKVKPKQARSLAKIGFGVALTHHHDGIMRGTSTAVTLAKDSEHEVILKDKVANQLSFKKGTSRQNYPSSLMGAIALIKQTYLDAQWYKKNENKIEYNISLSKINQNKALLNIFDAENYLNVLRANEIAKQHKVKYIFKGKEDLYKRIKDIKGTKSTFIVPVNYPKAYDVTNLYDAKNISLSQLKHWENAPYNLSILAKNKIEFAITSFGTEAKDFLKNIRKAIKKGLPKQKALQALTHTPAKLLKLQKQIGSLKKGMLANFFITQGDIFEKKNRIEQHYIQGKSYIFKHPKHDIRGTYTLRFANKIYDFVINGSANKPNAKVETETEKGNKKVNTSLQIEQQRISFYFNPNDDNYKKTLRFAGNIGTLKGQVALPNGKMKQWTLTKQAEIKQQNAQKKDDKKAKQNQKPTTFYPNMAYGEEKELQAEELFITNVTAWTNEKEGILKGVSVHIKNGKIHKIGKMNALKSAKVIDGTGKHLTPGIIDEHSHIAISNGVNEGSQASTAEVSIADVVNPDDINIYRQLSGGVVASQLLHGSANPIGGQSAIIKLKWGKSAEKMKIKNAPKFIKFALGENVKQTNWGDDYTVRFPQTRMGVEQVYYDAFIRAREYEKQKKAYKKLSSAQKKKTISPRKDLDLETLLEILNKKRFITCHSYIQSEIVMLMRVADSMGFTLNTFTHILEGYKVADKMKKHNAGASTFSDWWAYKYEVNDAIPHNAAILHKNGVLTAINSDDAEMARRLNQEAAKTIKYGGVSQEEALKMVTLNPAKLLHLDDKMGSLKKGKSADVVLWSANPLSVYAKAEKTIIEGVVYFDAEKDLKLRQRNTNERQRIINKMLKAKDKGAQTQKIKPKKHLHYHCDTEIDYH